MAADTLTITDFELWTRIGVPEAERQSEQRILVTVQIELREGGAKVGETDDVADTVNYEEIVRGIQALAKEERQTLEKLAEDIASAVQKDARVHQVTVTLRKFILPGTREVACTIARSR